MERRRKKGSLGGKEGTDRRKKERKAEERREAEGNLATQKTTLLLSLVLYHAGNVASFRNEK